MKKLVINLWLLEMWLNSNLGEMISNYIIYLLFIIYLNIKFLKENDLPNKSFFGILLVK